MFSASQGARLKRGDDLGNRPIGISFDDVELWMACARAMASGAPAELRRTAEVQLEAANKGIGYCENAMTYLAAAGFLDDAYAVARAMYLGDPPGASSTRFASGLFVVGKRRQTHHLFMPPTAAMRADPRFPGLAQAIGLADYWRASGHLPDDPRWLAARG